MALLNLGNVFDIKAELLKGNERIEQHKEAIQASNNASEVYTPELRYDLWITTKNNIAISLIRYSHVTSAKERLKILDEAISKN